MTISLTLPAHLASLLARDQDPGAGRSRSVRLDAATWTDLARDIHARFPALAERVLDGTERIRPGFALVVNDDVVHDCSGVVFSEGDDVVLIAVMAGGTPSCR